VNKPPAAGKQAAPAPSQRAAVRKAPAAGKQAVPAPSQRAAVRKPPEAGKQAAPAPSKRPAVKKPAEKNASRDQIECEIRVEETAREAAHLSAPVHDARRRGAEHL